MTIAFSFGSLWRRKIDKKGRGIRQKQSKEAEIKFLESLHTRRNTVEKLGLSLAINISTGLLEYVLGSYHYL